LNKELLPLLGLPTNAMFIFFVKIKLDAKVTAIVVQNLRNWKEHLRIPEHVVSDIAAGFTTR
jgi:hypothetical protein